MKYLDGLPDDEINKITHLNAMNHFKFDPFKHIPTEECTVGALRAQATRRRHHAQVAYGTGAFKKDGGIVTAITLTERIAARSGR